MSQYSNITRLFDPGVYFTLRGGPLTGNAGALAATSAKDRKRAVIALLEASDAIDEIFVADDKLEGLVEEIR